jgi:hypothetical protein
VVPRVPVGPTTAKQRASMVPSSTIRVLVWCGVRVV